MPEAFPLPRVLGDARVLRCGVRLAALLILCGGHVAEGGTNAWTSHGPPGGFISTLTVHPLVPNTAYAGTNTGVFKSLDGGTSWKAINTGLPTEGPFTRGVLVLAVH